MEENTILPGQIDIMEALKMVEKTKEVQAVENNEEEKSYKVTDLSSATWCFKKIKANNDKIAELEAVAEEQINSIKEWLEAEKKHYNNSFLEFKLQEYYKEQKEKDSKFRLSTAYGTVTSRKTPTYNYVDEEQVIKYLKENHSSALRVKEEINRTEFKKIYKDGIDHETGEIIPGVEVGIVESFSIKTK